MKWSLFAPMRGARSGVARGMPLLVPLCAVFFGAGLAARAGERALLPGPVPARVLRVIDGDTLLVRARLWVGQSLDIQVRLDGVDAPELRGRCTAEREAARAARAFLEAHLGAGDVALRDVHYGKYAGRVLARVATADGTDLAAALIGAGLVRVYDGGRRSDWCG